MNWKRGLTRIYVLFWVAIAMYGAFTAFGATYDYLRPRRELDAFLREHREITRNDLLTLPVDSLNRLISVPPLPERNVLDIGRNAKQRFPYAYDDMSDAQLGRQIKEKVGTSLASYSDVPDWADRTSPERLVRIHQMRDAADSPLPFGAIAGAWGLWAVLCLALPAATLLLLRWIITGFART